MDREEILKIIKKTADEANISPILFKIGVAVLMQESQLNPMACCFNLGFRRALYNCVYDGDKTIIHKPTGKWYAIDKVNKTLTCGDVVIKYWSWDRGLAEWNSRAWPQITDEMAFDPEKALPLFWYWFSKKPVWWNGFKSGAYKQYYET